MSIEQLVEEKVLQSRMKDSWVQLADEALENPEFIPVLFSFLKQGTTRVARTSAEIIRYITDKDKEAATPFIDDLIEVVKTPCHDSIKRCVFRIFQNATFTEDQMGKILDVAFPCLEDRKNPIAVRVFAMTTIYQITKTYPELFDELVAIVSANLNQESTGFQNRAQKIIARKW